MRNLSENADLSVFPTDLKVASNKNIIFITYSNITKEYGEYRVNSALGMLMEGVAGFFKRLYLVIAEAPLNSPLYQDGKSIYSYRLLSGNINLVRIFPGTRSDTVLYKVITLLRNALIIFKAVRKSDIAYIFLPGYTGMAGCWSAILLGKPYVLYFGSVWEEIAGFRVRSNILFPFYKNFYLVSERYFAKKSKLCLVAGKKLLNKFSGLNRSVYEAVPRVQFVSNTSRLKDKRDISKEVRLLFVGPIQESKGLEYLVKAVPDIESAGIEVSVRLVGGIFKEYEEVLKSLIEELSLDNNIIFEGYVSDKERLQNMYADSDIYICPSQAEGFPRSIYEAMVSGLPVVTTSIDSICENLDENGLVSFVSVRDSGAIAEAVIELCRNEGLRAARIKKGDEFALRRLEGDPAEQFIGLIRKYGLI